LHIENTEINRLSFVQDVIHEIEKDPRVLPGSTKAAIVSWEQYRIKLSASCQPVTGGNSLNMVFGFSSSEITGEVTN
jgi:hypothetical protein